MAIIISAAAAVAELKLRDQPSSCSKTGMTSPKAARAEYASANTTKESPTINQGRQA